MGEGKIGCVGFAYPEVELVGCDDDGKIGPVFNLRKGRVAIHALSLAGRPIFLQGPGHGGYRDHKTDTCSSCHYFVAILFGIAIGVMGAAAANTN
jgi:hypothetical protein